MGKRSFSTHKFRDCEVARINKNPPREPATNSCVKKEMTSSAPGSRAGRGGPRPHQFKINLIVVALAAVPCSTYGTGISVRSGIVVMISDAANHHQTSPTVARIWSDIYRSFNMNVAGTSFNSIGAKIQAIVNLPTSSNRRIIYKPIGITGSHTNVILAHPSGNRATDDSFVNIGCVSVKNTVSTAGILEQDVDVQSTCVDSGAINRSAQ
jgi:filamentous hemagglutinin family protein